MASTAPLATFFGAGAGERNCAGFSAGSPPLPRCYYTLSPPFLLSSIALHNQGTPVFGGVAHSPQKEVIVVLCYGPFGGPATFNWWLKGSEAALVTEIFLGTSKLAFCKSRRRKLSPGESVCDCGAIFLALIWAECH